MNEATAQRLMQSIAADSLTIMCGAGLSMAEPSKCPPTTKIASTCAERYQATVGTALDGAIINDIEKMSQWFREEARFDDLFIGKLVPWESFNTTPNAGHDAIADFLGCSVATAGISTNYDCLIEEAARSIGEPDFLPIIEPSDLAANRAHAPLLKVHGCAARGPSRLRTIWCKEQLNDPLLTERTERFKTWLKDRLVGRDVLIVGFWSDWAYLCDIFANSLQAIGPKFVFLVDPSTSQTLTQKAPKLWEWANTATAGFTHIQESGADFLDELRKIYSKTFLKDMLNDSTATYAALFQTQPSGAATTLPGTSDQLYSLRQDLTAVPFHRPVRERTKRPEFRLLTALHSRLVEKGAVYASHTYSLGGHSLRLISGRNQLLSEIKAQYREEPQLPLPVDRVVCIGAIADPTPAHLVRGEEQPGIIRGGAPAVWLTQDELIAELKGPDAGPAI